MGNACSDECFEEEAPIFAQNISQESISPQPSRNLLSELDELRDTIKQLQDKCDAQEYSLQQARSNFEKTVLSFKKWNDVVTKYCSVLERKVNFLEKQINNCETRENEKNIALEHKVDVLENQHKTQICSLRKNYIGLAKKIDSHLKSEKMSFQEINNVEWKRRQGFKHSQKLDWVLISGFFKNTDPQDIIQFLKSYRLDNGCVCKEVTIASDKTFKIGVPGEHLDKVMDVKIWPQGTRIALANPTNKTKRVFGSGSGSDGEGGNGEPAKPKEIYVPVERLNDDDLFTAIVTPSKELLISEN